MAVDPARALLLVVGLGEGVAVTDVKARRGGPLVVDVRLMGRPCRGGCGARVWAHGSARVRLVDLPAFGRPVRLVWTTRRWPCPDSGCEVVTFTDQEPGIAQPRARVTAALRGTRPAGQVRDGRSARSLRNWAAAGMRRCGRRIGGAAPSSTPTRVGGRSR